MDFQSMKRKELQAICKKHKIPANLSNLEMVKRLTLFFKEKENSLIQGMVNGKDENASETESTDAVIMNRKVKKVRFSPEHELIEFTRSREIKRRTRRNSVTIRDSCSSFENVETDSENVKKKGRVTRSRGLELIDGGVNEKKRGRKGVEKIQELKNIVLSVENIDNDEVMEGNVDGVKKVLHTRGKKVVESFKNAGRKRGKVKEDDKSDNEKALDSEIPIEEIVDSPGRITRSRWQKQTEVSVTKTKRVRRVVETVDNNVALISTEIAGNRVVNRRSFRQREGVGGGENVKSNGKAGEEVLENTKISEVHHAIEKQVLLRRSKRNANNTVGDSQRNDGTREQENCGTKAPKKIAKLPAADVESTRNKVDMDGRVLCIEEPNKVEVRRSNRRKEVIASHENGVIGELKAEIDNTYRLRSSVPQLVVADGVFENEKKVRQPIMRRSRRRTIILVPVASDEKSDTNAGVKNCETGKPLSTRRSRAVASVVKSLENNEARKRKRVPISDGGVMKSNYDQKMSVEETRNEKGVSIAEAELYVSEEDSDTRNKNIKSDLGLISNRKSHRERQDASTEESAGKKFIRNELESSDKNAAPRTKTESSDFEMQISAIIIENTGKVASLEFDVQDIVEQHITSMDKNQFEVQLLSEMKDSRCINTVDNQILNKGSNVSGIERFAHTSSSAESVLLADLEVTHAEADDMNTQPCSDHVGEVDGVSVQENLDTIETEPASVISSLIACHHNDVDQPMEASSCIFVGNKDDRGLKAREVGGPESSEKSYNSTDLKSGLQLKKQSSGEVGNIEGDNAEKGDETCFEKVKVSELAEIEKGESLKDHQVASNKDGEFNVSYLSDGERSGGIIPHDRGIISGQYSAMKSDQQGMDNKDDRCSKVEEVGAPESCEKSYNYTDSRSALQLKKSSSGKVKSIEGDNADEGDQTCSKKIKVPESAEIEKGESLKDHQVASNKDGKFNASYLSAGERSVGIIPQDRGMISGENSAMKSDPSLTLSPITTCPNITSISLERDIQAVHTGNDEEIISSENSVKDYDEKGMDVKLRTGHEADQIAEGDCEFNVPDLSDRERTAEIIPLDRGIISGEYLVMKLDEQPMDKKSLAVSHITTCPDIINICLERDLEAVHTGKDEEIVFGENSTKDFVEKGMDVDLWSGHEADHIAEGDDAYVHEDIKSQPAENDEGGCLKNHNNTNDEHWEFNVSHLFAGEKSVGNTPQDRGVYSAEDLNKDFSKQVVYDDSPAEFKINAGSISLKEINPFKLHNSSISQGTGPKISDAYAIIDNENGDALIPDKEVAIFQTDVPGDEMTLSKNISDGGHEILNQADEHINELEEEQPKSPPAIPTVACNGQVINSPVVKISDADECGNDVNCGKGIDEVAVSCIRDVDMSMDCTISKLGALSVCELEFHHTEDNEYQSENLHEKHTTSDVGEKPNNVESGQCWTELELSNLFETTLHDVTPAGLNDTTSQGAEIVKTMLCLNKSDVNAGKSLTNKEKELEGEKGSASAKTMYGNAFLPTNYKEVSDSDPGSSVDREDNQLKLLFATPMKIDSPSKVDETSCHEKKLDRADASITEYVGTTKENAVAQIKPGEKVRAAENELDHSLCRESSSGGEEINYEKSIEIESVGPVNASTLIFSEASYEHLVESTCECLMKSDFETEENNEETIISLGESCLYEGTTDYDCDSTEKNTISSPGSMRNLSKLETCQDMVIETDSSEKVSCGSRGCLKSNRKVERSSEAKFELSDVDSQKSDVIENSHNLTAYFEDNKLRETLIDTFEGSMDSKVASISSFNGTYPSLFSKASNYDDEVVERKRETRDDDDPYEAKMSDKRDDVSISFLDISDEPHSNSAVEIFRSPSVDNSLEPQSTCKETGTIAQNVDNVLPDAEQESFVRGAAFDVFSSLTMHLLSEENEEGDYGKSVAGTLVHNSEGGHEKNSKQVEENLTTTNVQFSIPELHSERKVVDSKNDVHSILDEVTDNGNGDIEKSDMGTPLINIEGGDHKKNDKEVDENLTATLVQFPILELNSEEKLIDSKNNVPAAAVFGCNECLKESDVADTIKEYIDSEFAGITEMATCEIAAFCESAEDVIAGLVEPEGEDDLKSVQDKTKELEENEALCVDLHVRDGDMAEESSVETKDGQHIEGNVFKESVTGPKTVPSPASVELVENSEFSCISESEDMVARLVKPEGEDDLKSVQSQTKDQDEQQQEEEEEALCVDLHCGGYTSEKSSVGAKVEQQMEGMLFKESVAGPKTVHFPSCVDLAENSGSALIDAFVVVPEVEEIESEGGRRSSSGQLCSTAKKNVRTIIIHGTPSKAFMTNADMKENASTHKSSNVGDITAQKPARRKALQDFNGNR
ncbi:hypothetical protein OROGR_032722 [Orobanche gracilis]